MYYDRVVVTLAAHARKDCISFLYASGGNAYVQTNIHSYTTGEPIIIIIYHRPQSYDPRAKALGNYYKTPQPFFQRIIIRSTNSIGWPCQTCRIQCHVSIFMHSLSRA